MPGSAPCRVSLHHGTTWFAHARTFVIQATHLKEAGTLADERIRSFQGREASGLCMRGFALGRGPALGSAALPRISPGSLCSGPHLTLHY